MRSSGWRQLQVSELGRVVTGRTPPGNDAAYYGSCVPFLTPTDMIGQRRLESTARSLSPYGVAKLTRCVVPSGVGVSCIGWQMGKSILLDRPTVTNQQINSIIVDEEIADRSFVYYTFVSRRAELFNLGAGGSRTPILNKGDFERLWVTLPPLDQQRAIAQVLSAFDDKIELNQTINRTLEAALRALFRSWFVDFDPVRNKANVTHPVADFFPDSVVDSELGEIPEGWKVRSLDQIAHFLNGLALQKFPPGDGPSLPVIKIAQLRIGHSAGADRADASIKREYIVNDGDVIFSWSGSLECVVWAGGAGALNQHLFKLTSQDYPKWLYYLGTHLHLPHFRNIAAGKATTMGHIQRHHLSDAKLAIPEPRLLDFANEVFEPMLESIWKRGVQCRIIAELRDALMPKLLSGDIEVTIAEELVEATL